MASFSHMFQPESAEDEQPWGFEVTNAPCKTILMTETCFAAHLRSHSKQCELQAFAAKESPMERMKRLRAAQLNKTFQKDVLSNAQKKANEERDRNARLQIERNAYESRRSPSPASRLSEPCYSRLPACWENLAPISRWMQSATPLLLPTL